ncbi:MAG TPA: hypothetical protein PK737_00740 [Bacilli bacterium]|nr:hypothetical protein [Bacilli bacterium]
MKKKTIIILSIVLILILVGVWFFGSLFGIFKPKDLGIRYTKADYQSILQKSGLEVVFEAKTGSDLKAYIDDTKGDKLYIDDYNFTFSEYEQKKFTITPEEATAFLNEFAPSFFWFKNMQVNVLADGTMEESSTVDIGKLKVELYADVADKVPVPIPNKVNIYSKGLFTVTDNKLTLQPEQILVGKVPVPKKYIEGNNLSVFSKYLERIYNIVPGFKVNSFKADGKGNFYFDGIIPQKVIVTKK